MKNTRFWIGLAILAAHPLFALPSDALLDSLSVASAEQERSGHLTERDQTESVLEMLARQRIISDSAPQHARKLMALLDQFRSQRSLQESKEQSSLPKPVPEVNKMLESQLDSEPDSSLPVVQKPIETMSSPPRDKMGTTICSSGPIKIAWLPAVPKSLASQGGDSAFPYKIRIEAPCGLSRIDLYLDELKHHSFPVPSGKMGTFEFSDQIALANGIHRLEIVACDSTGICTRSLPMESRPTDPVPPWIPRAVGALVGLCVLLGIALSLRKFSQPHSPNHLQNAVPLPESTGISATIRHRVQMVAKEIGPSFPAISLRLPASPPALSIDPDSLGDVFGTILLLHARRTNKSGQILVAMGQGPLSVEVVIEDTAASPDEASIPLLLDANKARLKERI